MNARRGAFVILAAVALAAVGFAPSAIAAALQHRMGTVAAGYPPQAKFAVLHDVACADRSHCFAVGDAHVGTGSRTLFERWTGSRWAVMPGPTPATTILTTTSSVSCSSSTACMTVGFYLAPGGGSHFKAFAERWNGSRWRLLPSPTFGLAGSLAFDAVSCPAARFCVVVGSNFDRPRGPSDLAITATWNGTSWHVVHRDAQGSMEGISCPSVHSCVAIFRPGKGNHLHRLQLADGRWRTHIDNLVGVQSTITFNDLDCLTASSCTAVGSTYSEGSPDAAAAYHWNGTVWRTLHPGARMRTHSRELFGVSCPTATECVAVGRTDRGPSAQGVPLVEQFHGGRTEIVPASTTTNAESTGLNAVACFGGGTCRGVGWHTAPNNSTVTHPFADQGVLF